jgi:hypothetical protein
LQITTALKIHINTTKHARKETMFGPCTALVNPESLFLEIFSIYIALACVSGFGVECTKVTNLVAAVGFHC